MALDLRIPLGLMFVILGCILTATGGFPAHGITGNQRQSVVGPGFAGLRHGDAGIGRLL